MKKSELKAIIKECIIEESKRGTIKGNMLTYTEAEKAELDGELHHYFDNPFSVDQAKHIRRILNDLGLSWRYDEEGSIDYIFTVLGELEKEELLADIKKAF